MKKIFSLLALSLALSLPAEEKAPIQFSRPIAPGSQFDCDISASSSRDFSMSMPGVDTPLKKFESSTAILSGRMTVLEVNAAGNSTKMKFQIKSFDGSIDHVRPDLAGFKGRTIIADLNPPVCRFVFEDFPQEMLSKDSVRLLSSIFRPSMNAGMNELLGTSQAVGPGSSWRPPMDLLLEQLRKRGMKFNESDFEGAVSIKGRETFNGVECWRIEESLRSINLAGFDLRLDISLLLPCDPKQGGARKISRAGLEFVAKDMPESNPLSAGKRVEATVKDSMDATILPVR